MNGRFKLLHPDPSHETIVIATTVSGVYVKGFASGAFAIVGQFAPSKLIWCGGGGVRDTHALFAVGLSSYLAQRKSEGIKTLRVYVQHIGVAAYFADMPPKWVKRNKRNSQGKRPDAFVESIRLFEALSDGSLTFASTSEDRSWGVCHASAHRFARCLADVLRNRSPAEEFSVKAIGGSDKFEQLTSE